MPEPEPPPAPATASASARPRSIVPPTPPPRPRPPPVGQPEPERVELAPGRPPFDTVRAAFYLVAGVIALQGVVIVTGGVACAVYAARVIGQNAECFSHGDLATLLAEAMAAALAFAGFSRKP